MHLAVDMAFVMNEIEIEDDRAETCASCIQHQHVFYQHGQAQTEECCPKASLLEHIHKIPLFIINTGKPG